MLAGDGGPKEPLRAFSAGFIAGVTAAAAADRCYCAGVLLLNPCYTVRV